VVTEKFLISKPAKIIAIVSSAITVAFVLAVYGLWHGYFDRGQYELLSTEWSESRQLAMIAKRSDHQALNGDEIFVLVSDHLFSPTELRYALHGPTVIFSTDRDCLSVRWTDTRHLVISCQGEPITDGEINRQKHQINEVMVSYSNIVNAEPNRPGRVP
jgi:hypothetical protein